MHTVGDILTTVAWKLTKSAQTSRHGLTVCTIVACLTTWTLVCYVSCSWLSDVRVPSHSTDRFLFLQEVDRLLNCGSALVSWVPVWISMNAENFSIKSSQHFLQMWDQPRWVSSDSARDFNDFLIHGSATASRLICLLLCFLLLLLGIIGAGSGAQKFLDFRLKVTAGWMSLPCYGATLVDEGNMRNSSKLPWARVVFASLIVFNAGPTFFLNALFGCFVVLVNRNTNDADLSLPVWVVVKHLLVVGHGSLARRAPSGPEINEHNFSIVHDALLITVHVDDAAKCNEFVPDDLCH